MCVLHLSTTSASPAIPSAVAAPFVQSWAVCRLFMCHSLSLSPPFFKASRLFPCPIAALCPQWSFARVRCEIGSFRTHLATAALFEFFFMISVFLLALHGCACMCVHACVCELAKKKSSSVSLHWFGVVYKSWTKRCVSVVYHVGPLRTPVFPTVCRTARNSACSGDVECSLKLSSVGKQSSCSTNCTTSHFFLALVQLRYACLLGK